MEPRRSTPNRLANTNANDTMCVGERTAPLPRDQLRTPNARPLANNESNFASSPSDRQWFESERRQPGTATTQPRNGSGRKPGYEQGQSCWQGNCNSTSKLWGGAAVPYERPVKPHCHLARNLTLLNASMSASASSELNCSREMSGSPLISTAIGE